MILRDHRLAAEGEERVGYRESPHPTPPLTAPRFLIMHFTQTATLAAAVDWFLRPESRVSAHVVIGRDGELVQMVPFNRRAWHAGKSAWAQWTDLNAHSIGIELVNAGPLRRNRAGAWVASSQEVVGEDEVERAAHRSRTEPNGWQVYPESQIAVALRLASLLKAEYSLAAILGHEDVSPGRKLDPGPLFPMERFRAV